MFVRISAPTASLTLAASFVLGGITACSSSPSSSDSAPSGDVDSGHPFVDDAAVAPETTGVEARDAETPDAGPAPADGGTPNGDGGDAYGAAGDAGIIAFCTAFCSFARQCAAGSDSGATADASAPCDCKPASLGIQRADYVADITSCLAGLDAGSCGDASGSASDCVDQAGASLTPSPAAVSFCKADELSACPLRGCLSLVSLYGDPTVEQFPACLPDAGTATVVDGGCDDFKTCVSAALAP